MKKIISFLIAILSIISIQAQNLSTNRSDAESASNAGIKVSILSASYSTFLNHVTPSSNAVWYPDKENKNDVVKVEQMWWYQLLEERGATLEINNSYSGSTICTTGYNGSNSTSTSFVTRMKNVGNPDIIYILGGTNDSWANSPIGEYKYSDWTTDDLKSFRPAFAYMLDYLIKNHPNAKIVNVINSGLKTEIAESQASLCTFYKVTCVQLKNIDKISNHPSISGMISIKNQLLHTIEQGGELGVENLRANDSGIRLSRSTEGNVVAHIDDLNGHLKLEAYSLTGNLMKVVYNGNAQTSTYELPSLGAGIYLLKATTSKGTYGFKY